MIFDSTKKAGKLSDGTAKTPQHMSYDTKAIVDRLVDVYSSMSSFTPIDNFQRSGKTWFNFGDEFTDGQHTYGLYVSVKRNKVAPERGVEIYAKVATENGRKTVVELEQYLHEPDYRTGAIKAIRSLMEKMRQDLIVAAKREGLKQTRTGRRKS